MQLHSFKPRNASGITSGITILHHRQATSQAQHAWFSISSICRRGATGSVLLSLPWTVPVWQNIRTVPVKLWRFHCPRLSSTMPDYPVSLDEVRPYFEDYRKQQTADAKAKGQDALQIGRCEYPEKMKVTEDAFKYMVVVPMSKEDAAFARLFCLNFGCIGSGVNGFDGVVRSQAYHTCDVHTCTVVGSCKPGIGVQGCGRAVSQLQVTAAAETCKH